MASGRVMGAVLLVPEVEDVVVAISLVAGSLSPNTYTHTRHARTLIMFHLTIVLMPFGLTTSSISFH